MKLEDVKLGQILKDKFGNKYKVTAIEKNDLQSVIVTCIEFKKEVCVGDLSIIGLGDAVWLLNDRSILLSLESSSGEKIAKNLKFTAFSKPFKKITISSGFDSQDFLLCQPFFFNKIDVTLSDLEECDASSDRLTKDNVKIGMTVSDGLGNTYEVIDYSIHSVKLELKMETVNVNGEGRKFYMHMWVSYESDVELSMKDFRIIEKDKSK